MRIKKLISILIVNNRMKYISLTHTLVLVVIVSLSMDAA